MLGDLTDIQIKNLLLSHTVGRIGFIDGNKPFIIPVTYIFDNDVIISQANEGHKLESMRKNKLVCFQVDMLTDPSCWQSVMIGGEFEELHEKDADAAREKLYDRIFSLHTNAQIHPYGHAVTSIPDDSNRVKKIMYQIKITDIIGKFEKP